ncbi:MAG TPA: DUF3592 domain-containing protein [Myxococcaceae bacterium]|nr:DUF3592 domain-containing protein [Myxococcaceae bacterium]
MARGIKTSPTTAFVLGIVMLLVTSWWLVGTVLFAFHSERAEGVVTELYSCSSGRKSGKCASVSYTRKDGSPGTLRDARGVSKGETVEVLYDPRNPDDARQSGPMKLWFGPVIGELVGLGLFAAGMMRLRDGR